MRVAISISGVAYKPKKTHKPIRKSGASCASPLDLVFTFLAGWLLEEQRPGADHILKCDQAGCHCQAERATSACASMPPCTKATLLMKPFSGGMPAKAMPPSRYSTLVSTMPLPTPPISLLVAVLPTVRAADHAREHQQRRFDERMVHGVDQSANQR